ncbi:MAG: hypothetical protein Q7T50_03370 [Candidatus Magasanikbacteria bacterium]|nr:hypothetical protein [Candidatus Magasanikbacteria bacterium]
MKNIIKKVLKTIGSRMTYLLVGLSFSVVVIAVNAAIPWTNVPSRGAGQTLTSADWNAMVNDLNSLRAAVDAGTGPVYITPVAINSGTGTLDWTTYNASALVPAGAKAVILEGRGAMGGPDCGGCYANMLIRKSATEASEYVLIRGSAWGGGDAVAWGGQGTYPITAARTFQYYVGSRAFGTGWSLTIIGYIL